MPCIITASEPISSFPNLYISPYGNDGIIPLYSSIPIAYETAGECLPCVLCGNSPTRHQIISNESGIGVGCGGGGGGEIITIIPSPIIVGTIFTGAISQDWYNIANWTNNDGVLATILPNENTSVIINATFTFASPEPIVKNAIFNSSNSSNLTVTQFATFTQNNSHNGTITGNCIFNNSSYCFGTVVGTAVFNGTSRNGAQNKVITGYATFNDYSLNDTRGVCLSGAKFTGHSRNTYLVYGDTIFQDNSSNEGNIQDGNVTVFSPVENPLGGYVINGSITYVGY